MNDKTIGQHIDDLVREEHRLRDTVDTPGANASRLREIEQQLDQCWDLLRQRRARREFGQDPAKATPRDIGTVERYEG